VLARAEHLVSALLLLLERRLHRLRLDELLQDDGEEEVDHEEAAEDDLVRVRVRDRDRG